jgi:hypothetical protein
MGFRAFWKQKTAVSQTCFFLIKFIFQMKIARPPNDRLICCKKKFPLREGVVAGTPPPAKYATAGHIAAGRDLGQSTFNGHARKKSQCKHRASIILQVAELDPRPGVMMRGSFSLQNGTGAQVNTVADTGGRDVKLVSHRKGFWHLPHWQR